MIPMMTYLRRNVTPISAAVLFIPVGLFASWWAEGGISVTAGIIAAFSAMVAGFIFVGHALSGEIQTSRVVETAAYILGWLAFAAMLVSVPLMLAGGVAGNLAGYIAGILLIFFAFAVICVAGLLGITHQIVQWIFQRQTRRLVKRDKRRGCAMRQKSPTDDQPCP